jgi:hypothetical protein
MQQVKGELVEIWLESGGTAGRIAFGADLAPHPGQYLAARCREDGHAALGHPLFMAGTAAGGMLAAPPLPPTWQPGCELELRGPLGHGFNLPVSARHVGLVALDTSPARLLSLAELALTQDGEVTLFCDLPASDLPWRSLSSALEISPTALLRDALAWADYLAFDVPLTHLARLHPLVGLRPGERLACPAEVLVAAVMPCAGLAGCGVCAVPARRGWLLACEDGPVFAWERLE